MQKFWIIVISDKNMLHNQNFSYTAFQRLFTLFRIIRYTSVQKFFSLKTPITLPYKNQSTDMHCKSISWFLYGTSFY